MLIPRLQAAVRDFQEVMERIEAYPAERQEALAERFEALVDELHWGAQFADPRSEALFERLAAEARLALSRAASSSAR